MLEIIALFVYLARLVALARSRGRSWAWALVGLLAWVAGDVVGWLVAPRDPLLAASIGIPLALVHATLVYLHVRGLPVVTRAPAYGRGHNFPCPWCASLQTEDHGGHLVCHRCGGAFGR